MALEDVSAQAAVAGTPIGATITLAAVTLAASGVAPITSGIAATLGPVSSVATGAVSTMGQASATLGAVTVNVTVSLPPGPSVGESAITLAPLAVTASNLPLRRITIPAESSSPVVIPAGVSVAYRKDFAIRRGNDMLLMFVMQTNGSIAGQTTRLTARTKHNAGDPPALDIDGYVMDPGSSTTPGMFGVTIAQDDTLDLDPRVYVYAFNRTDDASADTLSEGKLDLKPDVEHSLV
jgi:hypothetical protein